MPADVWYGGDCEIRIGRRSNAATPPTSWQAADFMQLTVSPSQEWRDRTKLGNPATRSNVLDPTRPRKGFYRQSAELVLDADSRSLPLWLRYAMGAPSTAAASSLYAHVFNSGAKTEQYFDIALKVGDTDVRVYEALTLAQISIQNTGENTQDFGINLSLMGLRRTKLTAFPAGTLAAAPAEAPVLRATFAIDSVVADNMLGSSWSYNRQIQEGIFLSATPTVSSLRPNGGTHSGSATYRAIGAVFDAMEEGETIFAAKIAYLGVVTGHEIRFEHPQALLQASPLPIQGVGMIERTLNWSPFQTSDGPAARITVVNDVTSYASA